jgi:NAD(P)-dependent dehydrogenase (short-subunit alcohol dehydrogenase family)
MNFLGRNAVIFGGSGAVGSAVAGVLAREGARVFIGARKPDRLHRAADRIRTEGGAVETFIVDVLDEEATISAIAAIAARAGGIDVAMNATGFAHDQGTPIDGLSLATFMGAVDRFLPALFVTAKAVIPHMGGARPGVILTITAPAARLAIPGHLGHVVSCAAEEAFALALASELGPRNIRVVGLRSHAIADAIGAGSYTADVFAPKARALGVPVEAWLEGAAGTTMLGRLPTLAQIAETAAFLASDRAGAMTGTIVNVTGGLVTP